MPSPGPLLTTNSEGLAVGRKVRIRSVEGLILIVEPEQASRR